MTVMAMSNEYITIGKIERAFGVKGEVRVRSLSDVPGRFEGLDAVTLRTADGRATETKVRHRRPIKDGYLLELDACATPEEAARFRGALIQIPRPQAPAEAPGAKAGTRAYYEYQLVGLTVENETGERLGTLVDVVETPGAHVLVVQGERGEHLLPATKEVVTSVDLDARVMNVRWLVQTAEGVDAV